MSLQALPLPFFDAPGRRAFEDVVDVMLFRLSASGVRIFSFSNFVFLPRSISFTDMSEMGPVCGEISDESPTNFLRTVTIRPTQVAVVLRTAPHSG